MGINTDAVQRLYVAYFNRPADPIGLAYWEGQLSSTVAATQAELETIAGGFSGSAEYAALYAGQSNAQIIDNLYLNLFARNAEPAGLIYWAGQLTNGAQTFAQIALQLTYSAQGTDADAITNKLAASTSFTTELDTTPEILGYNGTAAATSARTWLATVTDVAATLTTAQAGVATAVTAAVAEGTAVTTTGTTFTLTTSQDSISGGTGADSIYGTFDGTSTSTLNSFDVIDGSTGTDSLSITASNSYDGDATISNIENFLIRSTVTGKYFDMNGQSGVEIIENDRSSQDLTVKSVASAATTIVVDRMTSTMDMNVEYQATALTGATTVNLDLESVAVSGTTSQVNLYGAAGTTDGIETLNVSGNGSGASYLQILTVKTVAAGTATMTNLVIDGAQKVSVTNALDFKGDEAAGNTSTVDASASTGGVSLAFKDDEMVSVTGGTGNDTFTFTDGAGAANLTADDTVAGGDGTDTVIIDQSANAGGITSFALKSMNLTGIEVVQYESDDAQNVTLTTDGLTDLTTLNLVENTTDNKNYTVSDLAAGVGIGLINNIGAQGIGNVTLGLKDASGTADSLTVTLKGTSGDGTAGNDVEDIIFTNIETLSLVSSKSGTTAFTTTDANVINHISSDAKLTTINISGAEAITATVDVEATSLSTINASTATGNVTVTAGAGNIAVTGGAGNDTINFGTSLKNSDVIDGGAGTADVVTATINALTATTGALHISNVENIRLDTTGAASTIDATAITGATVLGFASAQSVTVTGLAAGTKIGLGYNATDDDYTGTLDVSLADATGTADTITFATVDTNADDVNATLKVAATVETTALVIAADTDAGANNAVTLNVANVKSATISISGGTAAEVVDLTGGGTTLSTATTKVDASAFDGNLKATASATATTFIVDGGVVHTITGGAGNDTITVSSTAANQDVDGGAGTNDILNMTMGGTVVATNIANFETYNFTVDASTAGIFTVATTTGINDNDTKTVTVTGGNSLSTMAIGAAGANAIGIADGSEATGLTSINATGFLGNMTLTFGDNVLDTNLTITGGSGTDTVKGTFAAADTVLQMSAVEKLYIETDGTATVDFVSTTGLTTVYVDDDNTSAATTLTDLASGVKVDLTTGAASSLTVDLKDKTATDNALTINLTTIVTGAALLIDDVETLTLDVDAASTVDLSAVQMTTASKVSSLVLTGAAALTVSALNADVTTIDGSGFSTGGTLIMGARSATAAMTITTADGDDTIIMKNGSDVLTAGDGTDSLEIVSHNVLGGIAVDLSSTADQITSYNGSANSAVQSGFENVDLSGLTGTSGAEITAHSGGSTIVGTANADVINGGAGVDIITGGGGVDIITLGDGADVVVLGDSTDASNYDQITGFTTAVDDIKALQSVHGWNSTADTTTVVLQTGATLKAADAAGDGNILTISANVATDTYVTFLAGTSTYAQLETAAAAAMGLTGALDAAAIVLVAIDDGTHTGLWQFTSDDAATDDATATTEIELIGILKDVSNATALVVGDFVFA